MKETISWTPDQENAIILRPNKMLVSAAAGSGKTAVLAERIIRRLTDPGEDADISRFLIVTYTRLAAAELRSRIGKKMREAAENADSATRKRLAKQCSRLGSAQISTIHSFCATLVKRNFQRLSLPAALKVCEEAQANELKTGVMEQLIEQAYAGNFAPILDFISFSDNFVTTKDKDLQKNLLRLYERVIGLPRGFEKWEETAELLRSDTPFLDTPWGEILSTELLRIITYAEKQYAYVKELLSDDSFYREKYYPVIDSDMQTASILKELLKNKDLSALSNYFSQIKFTSLPKVSGKNVTPHGLYFKDEVRKFFKDEITKRQKLTPWSLHCDEDGGEAAELRAMRLRSADIALSLIAFLREFHKRYSAEKERLGLLDFADLEQLTYKLLYNEDGGYTELCREVSLSFDEIFVDEFQDVNPMQSSIFNAISHASRIFQVGDIKQSIYGFRGAEPDIFASCRRAYTTLDADKPETRNAEELTVFLSANFRSLYPVTAFVNRIFDVIFHTPDDYVSSEQRIPYSSSDRLVCSRNDSFEANGITPKRDCPPVELLLINTPKTNSNADRSFSNYVSPDDEDEDINKTEAECRVIADKITALIQDGVNGGDIALVARSAKHVAYIEQYLLEKDITVANGKGAKLADMPEVLLALCLLSCVDNPHRDVKLAGALRSPVFGVTLDELIQIRRFKKEKGVSLYSALCAFTEKYDYSKGRRFIDFIQRIRRFSASQTASRVLWQIYSETDFFSVIYDCGKTDGVHAAARRANLIKLHHLASERENVGSDGIYTFLRRFEKMAESDNAPTASFVSDASTVRIFTTHGSKGLEFKYCFVCGLGHDLEKSKNRENSSDTVCDNELGIATRLRDTTGIIKTDTPIRRAIASKMKYTQFEEELRILYVALTRAKAKLYVSAAVEDAQALEAKARSAAKFPEPYTFFRLKLPIEWILTALYAELPSAAVLPPEMLCFRRIEAAEYSNTATLPSDNGDDNAADPDKITESTDEQSPSADSFPHVTDSALKEKLIERFTSQYRFKEAASIPAKVSVSRLYPSLLDEDEDEPIAPSFSTESLSAITCELTENGEGNGQLSFDTSPSSGLKPRNKEAKSRSLKVPLFTLGSEPIGVRQRLESIDIPQNYRVISEKDVRDNASPAEIGTATHLFMQFCDFENTEKNGIEAEIKRLCDERFILPYHAALIDRLLLKRFFSSTTYTEMRSSSRLRREVRFNTRLPASMFTENKETALSLKEETVLVQGVIDCYYVGTDGSLTLLDYKTDSFPPGMSEKAITSILKKRHSLQLSYYRTALERLLLQPVDKTVIFSFALGKAIPLKL
ncbi:MAG: UvrD-helicase domain-containing protein [Clostridia bacterium]|nr:UvrD-helicase domain-containing protein [Clostridia bacterium]